MKDFYAILGVSPSAGESEIKRAFRKLAVRYHPDKNASADANSLFQEINEAYDILSDREKRARYDARLANPFEELITEPATPHRDPAYRRRQPYTAPRKNEPPASYILMRDYLKYVLWISRIGLLASTLFFLDYFLPYQQREEQIREISLVRYRHSVAYQLILTETGRKIKLYNPEAMTFRDEPTITFSRTRLYGTVMSVSNSAGDVASVAYMYRNLIFLPVVLFVNSLLGLVFRKRVEWCFNLNVTAFIWLIINFILI